MYFDIVDWEIDIDYNLDFGYGRSNIYIYAFLDISGNSFKKFCRCSALFQKDLGRYHFLGS